MKLIGKMCLGMATAAMLTAALAVDASADQSSTGSWSSPLIASNGDDWDNGAGYGNYYGDAPGTSIYVHSECYNEHQTGCFRIYPSPLR